MQPRKVLPMLKNKTITITIIVLIKIAHIHIKKIIRNNLANNNSVTEVVARTIVEIKECLRLNRNR